MGQKGLETNFVRTILIFNLFIFGISNSFAQNTKTEPATDTPAAVDTSGFEEVDEGGGSSLKLLNGEPSKRRIRRHLSLIAGIKHDEELLIPNVPLNFKGSVDLVEMQRIKGTDTFRILPTKTGNGIITIHNKKTGQVLVEMRIDIRDQSYERHLREIKALLADIEGIEYKIVNSKILLDGYVLLPKDLIRLGNVVKQFGPDVVKSLVTLSPLARKKIVEYIAKDINNPEITVTSVGDFIKLEGVVNSEDEKRRVLKIVELYMPDIVQDSAEGLDNVRIIGRRVGGTGDNFIIDLITIRRQEDTVEPPPKMIQVVIHFVEFSDRYLKNFAFTFAPDLKRVSESGQTPTTTLGETINLVSNLLPKLQWARNHGFVRLLDTASVLTQDRSPASITRGLTTNQGATSVSTTPTSTTGSTGSGTATTGATAAAGGIGGTLTVQVTPTIKQERTGLVEMQLFVSNTPQGTTIGGATSITTKISVRDRQSAAFGGIINKKSANDYGGPSSSGDAIVTFNHGKKYEKVNGNFVVFVTPIIKSSASSGVEQVKKKFRMKE